MQLVHRGGTAVGEPVVQIGDSLSGLGRQFPMVVEERRLQAHTGEEHQRVVPIGKLFEGELRDRPGGELPRHPHLEAVEGAEDDVRRRLDTRIDVGRLPPVVEGLLAVLGEPVGTAGCLHLHDAGTGPVEVHDTDRRVGILEPGSSGDPIGAVALDSSLRNVWASPRSDPLYPRHRAANARSAFWISKPLGMEVLDQPQLVATEVGVLLQPLAY